MQSTSSAFLQTTAVVRRQAGAWVNRVWRHGTEAVLIRAAAVIAAGAVLARLYTSTDPGVLCPLRAMTGVPCPFCGSTTALLEVGSGDLAAALVAQPVTMLAVAALVTAPGGWMRGWSALAYRKKVALIAGALVLSWVYQLYRFGVLPLQ